MAEAHSLNVQTFLLLQNAPHLELLIDLLGRYARIVDHLAVRDVAQGAPLGGGSTFVLILNVYQVLFLKCIIYSVTFNILPL